MGICGRRWLGGSCKGRSIFWAAVRRLDVVVGRPRRRDAPVLTGAIGALKLWALVSKGERNTMLVVGWRCPVLGNVTRYPLALVAIQQLGGIETQGRGIFGACFCILFLFLFLFCRIWCLECSGHNCKRRLMLLIT